MMLKSAKVFLAATLFVVTRAELDCSRYAGADIMMAFSTAAYTGEIMSHVQKQATDIIAGVRALYPSARLGVSSFNDKWAGCLEESKAGGTHYCARIDAPLSASDAQLLETIKRMKATYSDNTFREDVMGGMITTALSPEVKWRSDDSKIARVMVIVTNTPYHSPQDVTPCIKDKMPYQGGGEYLCTTHEYPHVQTVSDALQAKGIIPIFVVDDEQMELYHDTARYLSGKDGRVLVMSKTGDNVAKIIVDAVKATLCSSDDAVSNIWIPMQSAGAGKCPPTTEWTYQPCPRGPAPPPPPPPPPPTQKPETTTKKPKKKRTKAKKTTTTIRTLSKKTKLPVNTEESEELSSSGAPGVPIVVASVVGVAAAVTAVTSGAYYFMRKKGPVAVEGAFEDNEAADENGYRDQISPAMEHAYA